MSSSLAFQRQHWHRCDEFYMLPHVSYTGPSSTWSRDTGAARATLVAGRAKNWLQTVFVSLQVENRSRASLQYVSDMLTPAADVTSRAMRSSTNCDYFVRRTTLWLGDRAFSVAAPRAWNRLPSERKTTTCSIETFSRDAWKLFYLILLSVLIRRDNVMRHRSVCKGRTTSPCCNCNCISSSPFFNSINCWKWNLYLISIQ